MSAQDKTEKALRELHVLLSKGEIYDGDPNRVVVNKRDALVLLKELAVCMAEMMDEYGLTEQGRDRAERESRKAGEEILSDAKKKAEDIYAASVMYSDEALKRVMDIMQETGESVQAVFAQMEEKLAGERREVSRDRSELMSQLQDLKDTEKYLDLIEERNKKLAKEKLRKEEDFGTSPYAKAPKPEIKINEEYFAQHGISFEPLDDVPELPEEDTKKEAPEITVNLDSEYFKWKEEEKARADGSGEIPEFQRAEKKGFFGKGGRKS